MQYNDNCCHAARPKWGNWVRWIVTAILVALLLRGCFTHEAEVPTNPVISTPTPTVTQTQATTFTSQLVDGHVTLTGAVKDQATKDAIVQAANAQYGADHVTDQLTIDANASNPDVDMNKLFAWQKSTSGTSVALNGKTVVLTGVVADEATKAAQGQAVTSFFGSGYTLDNQLTIAAASNMAKDQKCEDTLKSTVEFATGHAELTSAGKATLDQVATCLKDGRFEVAGYTDNQGKAEANQALSEARANSVVAYLTTKGVAADRMTAKGYGQTQPIASNDTAEGRQKNRRITFTAIP